MARLFAIVIDVAVAASFYFGLTMSMDGLINIGYFAGWLFAIINILGGLLGKEKLAKDYKHQSIVWRGYDVLTDALYVAFAAYSGWFVLASLFAFAAYSGWFVLASLFAIGAISKAGMKSSIEKDLLKARQESNTGN
ncbi:hypothetical protein HBA43_19275 [Providencia rettgeri]|uniref:hypothetical protein n=1 Tax=Providencia rettgeri TaxID=587 RepID=UPI0014199A37|nr:hypothetical protein [Providencia rettgeri]NIA76331.1 hypothetical protein [Providencia rettgeri]NIA80532.1 hypothetical protein [Providencia rettgeri]NIB03764.1 hypothetical protein [Providencia rettgeri]NIB07925.1 hypothetical protein [Providencia rettgeri]NIB21562.1 hypothetical protein [Providencia rettgeri]